MLSGENKADDIVWIHKSYFPVFFIHLWISLVFKDPSCVCLLSWLVMSDFCNPVDYSLPGSSAHEIFQAKILEQVAISYFRGSSQPRDQICVSCASCFDRCFLYHCATWEAPDLNYGFQHFWMPDSLFNWHHCHKKKSLYSFPICGKSLSIS